MKKKKIHALYYVWLIFLNRNNSVREKVVIDQTIWWCQTWLDFSNTSSYSLNNGIAIGNLIFQQRKSPSKRVFLSLIGFWLWGRKIDHECNEFSCFWIRTEYGLNGWIYELLLKGRIMADWSSTKRLQRFTIWTRY
jgi:hypothetical protein